MIYGQARHSLSRRAVVAGLGMGTTAAGFGTMTLTSKTGAQPAGVPVRRDITRFAQDTARLAKFEAAIKEMQDRSVRDPTDPKGWLANARAHADSCSIGSDDPGQIHFCWWFLSWHRAYITVTERKIRALTGDPSFAYPYWNWSSDRRIPQAFARAGSPLAKAIRYTPNRSVQDGEVDYFPSDPTLKQLGVAALGTTFFEATSRSQINRSFGGIARPNAAGAYGNNRLESTPHGPIHNYVGGVNGSEVGDMTDFETAARDPIFFAHHGNLDRLWETWRRDPRRKMSEPNTNPFLSHAFVFNWIDGTPMRITVAETLDTRRLGYVYDSLEVFRGPAPIAVAAAAQGIENRLAPVAREQLSVPVRPRAVANRRVSLEITDIEKPEGPITVGVFVKPANAAAQDPGTNVGSFAAVRVGGQMVWPGQTLFFDVTEIANRYAGQMITVELIPYRIHAQGAESYPPLKYGQMRIVSETP
jgi:hypothetical protein